MINKLFIFLLNQPNILSNLFSNTMQVRLIMLKKLIKIIKLNKRPKLILITQKLLQIKHIFSITIILIQKTFLFLNICIHIMIQIITQHINNRRINIALLQIFSQLLYILIMIKQINHNSLLDSPNTLLSFSNIFHQSRKKFIFLINNIKQQLSTCILISNLIFQILKDLIIIRK